MLGQIRKSMEVRLSEPQAAENRTETCFLQTDKKRLQIHRQGMQLPERKIPAYKHSACRIAEIPASDNSMPAGSDDGHFSYLRGRQDTINKETGLRFLLYACSLVPGHPGRSASVFHM